MAKKRKNSSKKHRFSPDHVQTAAPQAVAAGGSSAPVVPAVSSVGYATAQVVRRDVGRVLLLAGVFIALMIVLWMLFTHTGLGSAAYNAVKL